MIVVAQGGEVSLNARFYEYSGGPLYDPAGLTLEIFDDDENLIVGPLMSPDIVSTGVGTSRYIWAVPVDLPVGIYIARWAGDIHGTEVLGYEDIDVVSYGTEDPTSTLSFNDPNIEVFADHVRVKFNQSIKVSTITNGRFKLFVNTLSSAEVTDPFRDIVLADDYDSIGRYLKLYFKQELLANSPYVLQISGLTNAANQELAPINYIFETLTQVGYQVTVPDPEPIQIIDYSVASDLFSMDDIVNSVTPTSALVIGETSLGEDTFIDTDTDDGRITLKFNAVPNAAYVNSTYFKVQRKQIIRGMARWQTVPVLLTQDDSATPLPWVYVDFPSTDATPVYHTAGKQYWVEGYKYRIRVSKEVST